MKRKGEEHFSFKGFKSTKNFYERMITHGGMKRILFEATERLLQGAEQGIPASKIIREQQGEDILNIETFQGRSLVLLVDLSFFLCLLE